MEGGRRCQDDSGVEEGGRGKLHTLCSHALLVAHTRVCVWLCVVVVQVNVLGDDAPEGIEIFEIVLIDPSPNSTVGQPATVIISGATPHSQRGSCTQADPPSVLRAPSPSAS